MYIIAAVVLSLQLQLQTHSARALFSIKCSALKIKTRLRVDDQSQSGVKEIHRIFHSSIGTMKRKQRRVERVQLVG